MKSKLKTTLLAVILALFAVSALLFCVQAPVKYTANADIGPYLETEKGTTHVEITSDTTSVAKGGDVTFTLKVTTTRTDLDWYAITLQLMPVDANKRFALKLSDGLTVGRYLKVTDRKMLSTDLDAGYNFLPADRFDQGYGAQVGISSKGNGMLSKCNEVIPIFEIKVHISEDMPEEVTKLNFGFAWGISNSVVYGDGSISDFTRPGASTANNTFGQMTYDLCPIDICS